MTITIKDYGREESLDGALAQFAVFEGAHYPYGGWLAYCATLEIARAVAHALTMADERIIIEGPSR